MDKLSKIHSIIKKDGIMITIKKIIKYIYAKYLFKFYIFDFFNQKSLNKKIDNILNTNYDRIIIWRGEFGWNVPLFQRPQHIANNLSKNNCLVFYEVTHMTDDVKNIKQQSKNLYLINYNNLPFIKILEKKLKQINKPKYIQIYSTDCIMKIKTLENYVKAGYKVLYEYIDDLSPEIVGRKEIPKNMIDKYNYMINNKDDVFVVVTADELKEDVISKRGKENFVEASNGVDYDHFQNIDKDYKFDDEYIKILNNNKPIIGYYGAIANWIDYELLEYIASNRPEYNIVLIGIKYDESIEKSKINDMDNIFFVGPRPYNVLQNYANKFNVCMIPFVINNITNATSPVKLFEYMALNKPIITTPMKECKKYKSVYIGIDRKDFLNKLDKILNVQQIDTNYYELLKKEALQNTWEQKVKDIVNQLVVFEKNIE